MDTVTVIGVLLAGVLLLWLDGVAIFALKFDSSLSTFQKIAQSLVVLLFPYLGAIFILHFISQYVSEDVLKPLVPWPFHKIIFEGKPKPRRINDNNTAFDNFTDEPCGRSSSSHIDVGGD